jgi:hypothetical protein
MTDILVKFFPGALPLAVEIYPFGIKKCPKSVVESISHAGSKISFGKPGPYGSVC